MSRATARQISAIHAEAKRIGMDDDSRRDLMFSVAGKRSSSDLDEKQAQAVVRRMKQLGGNRPLSATATGKYAPVLRALWLSAWHLGAVDSADDRALIAFVKRQTGMDHTRFLTDHAEATKAIEAIKAICVRQGVEWPKGTRPPITEQKRAVLEAIFMRLSAAGVQVEVPALARLDGPALDKLQSRFGARLRGALGMEGGGHGK